MTYAGHSIRILWHDGFSESGRGVVRGYVAVAKRDNLVILAVERDGSMATAPTVEQALSGIVDMINIMADEDYVGLAKNLKGVFDD